MTERIEKGVEAIRRNLDVTKMARCGGDYRAVCQRRELGQQDRRCRFVIEVARTEVVRVVDEATEVVDAPDTRGT